MYNMLLQINKKKTNKFKLKNDEKSFHKVGYSNDGKEYERIQHYYYQYSSETHKLKPN